MLHKDHADCSMKEKLEGEGTGGKDIRQKAICFRQEKNLIYVVAVRMRNSKIKTGICFTLSGGAQRGRWH